MNKINNKSVRVVAVGNQSKSLYAYFYFINGSNKIKLKKPGNVPIYISLNKPYNC